MVARAVAPTEPPAPWHVRWRIVPSDRAAVPPSSRALALRLVLWVVGSDLVFKLLVAAAYPLVLGASSTGESLRVIRLVLLAAVPALAALTVGICLVACTASQSLDGEASAEVLQRTARRLRGVPRWIAVMWIAEWFSVLAVVALARGRSIGSPPVALFIGAVLVGVLPYAFTMVPTILGSTARAVSTSAREAGVKLDTPPGSLRATLTLVTVALVIAPTLYLSSLAASVAARSMDLPSLLPHIGLFLLAAIPFAVQTSFLFADMIASPVARMDEIVRALSRSGEVGRVGRLPITRLDELGALAESTNLMLDRLEAVEREHQIAKTALVGLAHTLEQRVEERTRSLADANTSLASEMEQRARAELELRHAQRLESVGRLAAGVAHEINTPIQFIGDNVRFLADAMTDLLSLVGPMRMARLQLDRAGLVAEASALGAVAERADLDYVVENAPDAVASVLDGVARVAAIVRSMKSFAHSGTDAMAPADLNQAVTATLVISRSEHADVADLVTDLGPLPPVVCRVTELNQVFLNLVVNAAHAIADRAAEGGPRGTIRIASRVEGDDAVIEVSDTGGGIPEAIRDRIFEPFFTTKEVGRGTGQGLAIARKVVTERHGGTLTFDTTLGVGTTFVVRLPITPRREKRPAASA